MAREATPAGGQVWRTDTGGTPLYVVAVEDGFAYVKRADSSKRSLASKAGAYLTALSEFRTWTRLS